MDCVFCNRSQFEERLVAIQDDHYVIATLGQITVGGYVLIVPKSHTACIGTLNLEAAKQLEYLAQYVKEVVQKEYGFEPTILEHGIAGQTVHHAHLHIIPKPVQLTERVIADFPGCGIGCPQSLEHVQRLYEQKPTPYLLWSDSRSDLRICWDPPAPAQYLRTITAELLGKPERANWRTMDPALDKQLWSQTVQRLKPYF